MEKNQDSTTRIQPLRFMWIAAQLTFETNTRLASILIGVTLLAGILPALVAQVGAHIVDEVVHASAAVLNQTWPAVHWVLIECGLMITLMVCQRTLSSAQTLLRAELGHQINVKILEKALTLSLKDFENPSFYDKLTRARREASSRPLSMVTRSLTVLQNLILLVSFSFILIPFSKLAVLVLLLTGIPSIIAEAHFSESAFRLFRWRSADTRMQLYLESVLSREETAKEIQLFGLGPRLLARYRSIFSRLYSEDRALSLKRDVYGALLNVLSQAALYGSYIWVVIEAVMGVISVGGMSMLIVVFRMGQSALTNGLTALTGIYEDALYLSTLIEYLNQPIQVSSGSLKQGRDSRLGIEFKEVSFSYPGTNDCVLNNINLHVQPGQSVAIVGSNGAGKTTLIKLLSGLYQPTSGQILLDGVDLKDWEPVTLRKRIGVIFQDFARYQFTVGENIGAGDDDEFDSRTRWETAATAGLARPFIEKLNDQYDTQLGNWFENGHDLSGGQWQKIALSRAFMRNKADILVLDEPTAAMDAEAEAEIYEHMRRLAASRIIWLISHRFSTVRSADRIIVLEHGTIIESGSHDELMACNGRYSRLFRLQAEAYR
jgi:ATP-binding cassette, subfamily B, bacterial